MRRIGQRRKSAPDQGVGVAFNALSDHRRETEVEAWICRELRLQDLFAGLTTREIRRDRLIVALEQRKLMDSHAGKIGGKAHTWRALVEKLYGAQQQSMDIHNV